MMTRLALYPTFKFLKNEIIIKYTVSLYPVQITYGGVSAGVVVSSVCVL